MLKNFQTPFFSLLATPAKLNLSLRIVGRRADGYHDLISVFEPLTLADCLSCRYRPDGGPPRFSLECPQLPDLAPEDNLVFKAARMMSRRAEAEGRRVCGEWHFFLDKRIPQGAGLGGGSGNAAAVINLFNDFYGLGLELEERRRLGARLGADVPFFVEPALSLAEGVGERLTRLNDAGETRYYLLVKPAFGIPTAWAYQALDPATFSTASSVREQLLTAPLQHPLVNDFEVPVMAAHPELKELKAWLASRCGCAGALMSGSGSCFYGLFHDFALARQAAEEAKTGWRRHGCKIMLAQNLG